MVQGEGNGCCGGVCMVVDGDDHPAHIDAHLAGGCFENPSIRLMRHSPIYLRCLMSCRGQQLLEDSGQSRYSESVHFGARNPEAADRSCRRWSPITLEQSLMLPLRFHSGGQNTTIFTLSLLHCLATIALAQLDTA